MVGKLDHLVAVVPGNYGVGEMVNVVPGRSVVGALNCPIGRIAVRRIIAGSDREMGKGVRVGELDRDPERVVNRRIVAAPLVVAATDFVIEDVERVFPALEIRFDVGGDLDPIPTGIGGCPQFIQAVILRVGEIASEEEVHSNAQDLNLDTGCRLGVAG